MTALHGSGSLLLGIAPAVLDLHESGMGGNLAVKERLNLDLVAIGVKALCGIRATGKCFSLARRRRAPRVRMQMAFVPGRRTVPQVSKQ
jgi:hypothetical protein